MIWLGVPVVDQHKLTAQFIESVLRTVVDDDVRIVIFDNASEKPYPIDHGLRWGTTIRYETNHGYYQPINDLADLATPGDIVALAHNDLIIYESGWDRRLRECFVNDGRLGMIGFLGSNQVDDRGGRGGGTMGNFQGLKGASMEGTGTKLTDLAPALIYDSLFMAMRQPVVKCLKVDEHFQLCHFGDRIWPLRAIENEWRVGVLGIAIDHIGGQTAVGSERIEADDRAWCNREGIKIPDGMIAGTAQYLEAERRYLSEFRDTKHMIPAAMNGWQIRPLQRVERMSYLTL
jgi:hypothetical protein